MKYLGLLLVFVLFGCQDDLCSYSPKNESIAVYGDSNCAACGSYAEKNGYVKVCEGGRKLIDVEYISPSYETVFLALGINDIHYGITAEQYREHLSYLLDTASSNVVCILPNPHPTNNSEMHRQAMIDLCPSHIDPIPDCGITIENIDGIHYGYNDHEKLGSCISVKNLQK